VAVGGVIASVEEAPTGIGWGRQGLSALIAFQQLRLWAIAQRHLQRENGQDMIEYALLAALISIVAIAIIILVGPTLKDLFQDIVNQLATT
jgi:Flp pilus assembly pilin Flp